MHQLAVTKSAQST